MLIVSFFSDVGLFYIYTAPSLRTLLIQVHIAPYARRTRCGDLPSGKSLDHSPNQFWGSCQEGYN